MTNPEVEAKLCEDVAWTSMQQADMDVENDHVHAASVSATPVLYTLPAALTVPVNVSLSQLRNNRLFISKEAVLYSK